MHAADPLSYNALVRPLVLSVMICRAIQSAVSLHAA
jgi:hypothetical protein